ncbi:flavodoxin domain-containing protein [Candidatus Aerophobetes bacterium]|nr:flavodoxin domain-containing protein [Candidatus Aerophobetes bacterium]
MPSIKILPEIWWVGAVDWNIRHFHGYTYRTQRGTTYNAYLIIDEKVALIDTVYTPFAEELIENIKKLKIEKIDYLIANHVEKDHSGALPFLLEAFPEIEVVGTEKCKQGLKKNYFIDLNFRTVKTGDKLQLGKKTLMFIEAPMLHWPDSMFTYLVEDAALFPNDAFGQHYATSQRFDDEVDEGILMEEAAKYYANILMPFGSLVVRKIKEIEKMNIPIKMIAPSHGVIWRKNPEKIIKSYLAWGENRTKPKAVVMYETMWGSTEKMAKKITEGLVEEKVEVKLFHIPDSDITEVVKEMLDAKGFIVGSSTHDNDMLPTISGFLQFIKGLKPKDRIAAVFGSYGWGGGAVRAIEKVLKESGVEIVLEPLSFKFVPDERELEKCYLFGKEFARALKEK